MIQRVKESADDYRYFPEPDLPPLEVDRAWVDAIRSLFVELPDAKIARYVAALGLDPRDAPVLATNRRVAEYFEAVVAASAARGSTPKVVAIEPKTVANWITGESSG